MNRRNPSEIAMIILAAGASKRMNGKIKQILKWKNTTLLGNTIEVGLNSNINDVYVVLGAHSEVISMQIKNYNCTILFNPKWNKGMGTSISFAIDYFQKNKVKYSAVLIALADQPLIDVTFINNLIKSYLNSNKNIIASKWRNKIGVPAIFNFTYFNQLIKLNQDFGARKIIDDNKADLHILISEENLQDIDTPSDYYKLYRKYGDLFTTLK